MPKYEEIKPEITYILSGNQCETNAEPSQLGAANARFDSAVLLSVPLGDHFPPAHVGHCRLARE